MLIRIHTKFILYFSEVHTNMCEVWKFELIFGNF
jgi:hypothetical protein